MRQKILIVMFVLASFVVVMPVFAQQDLDIMDDAQENMANEEALNDEGYGNEDEEYYGGEEVMDPDGQANAEEQINADEQVNADEQADADLPADQ